jgi:hypothetical protein
MNKTLSPWFIKHRNAAARGDARLRRGMVQGPPPEGRFQRAANGTGGLFGSGMSKGGANPAGSPGAGLTCDAPHSSLLVLGRGFAMGAAPRFSGKGRIDG